MDILDVYAKYTGMFNTTVSDIGDMCISRCHSGDNQFITMVAIYISPDKSLRAIQEYLQENLFIYFNINFADNKNQL